MRSLSRVAKSFRRKFLTVADASLGSTQEKVKEMENQLRPTKLVDSEIEMTIVELENIDLPAVADSVLADAIKNAGSEEQYFKKHPLYDWQRLAYALTRLRPGGRSLEIGPGRGYLTTMLYRSKLFDEIHAIDIVDRRKKFPEVCISVK